MFNYLVIYKNNREKVSLHGWKIYGNKEEIQEIKRYYKSRKQIDFHIPEFGMIKYADYNELMEDLEIVPITAERSRMIMDTFDSMTFGIFPI